MYNLLIINILKSVAQNKKTKCRFLRLKYIVFNGFIYYVVGENAIQRQRT
jgi:hypothetical protein